MTFARRMWVLDVAYRMLVVGSSYQEERVQVGAQVGANLLSCPAYGWLEHCRNRQRRDAVLRREIHLRQVEELHDLVPCQEGIAFRQ